MCRIYSRMDEMKVLPPSEVYERELLYMPWGTLIREVSDILERDVPKNGHLLDLMCGTGHLVGNVSTKRSDLVLEGVDINPEFIRYARGIYKKVSFEEADVLQWQPRQQYDAITCTAGIHHLSYGNQEHFIGRIADALKPSGFCILADPYIEYVLH